MEICDGCNGSTRVVPKSGPLALIFPVGVRSLERFSKESLMLLGEISYEKFGIVNHSFQIQCFNAFISRKLF